MKCRDCDGFDGPPEGPPEGPLERVATVFIAGCGVAGLMLLAVCNAIGGV